MKAGVLRHPIVIQRPDYVQDSVTGEMTMVAWMEVAKTWAAIEPLSAREFIAAATTQTKVSARIVIRYRDDIDATMRILHRGKIYNIEGVLADKDSGRDYVTLPVSEGVNDG
ncbi:phage head closure protein [Pseudomonas sp. R5(2019)]|uniref:phage head closure protein n=1 Tax=Pseudomonas sp. R5(2019) TaxID=2697566 RepID=UPI0014122C34|nr:phage head closure protein [Pseudomonas sp. R5(2019)]NBA95509.1 phage head closure protein [Pseudomonas sp. R5(2019)]